MGGSPIELIIQYVVELFLFKKSVGYDIIILPETNIAPKNGWLKTLLSYWGGLFSSAFAVSFREGIQVVFVRPLEPSSTNK